MSKPASQRLALATLGGALLILVVGYLALIGPHRSEAAKLSRQIDETRSAIDARRIPRRRTTVQAVQVADLFRLARAMPSSTDMPDVLLQLSQVASQTGITFKSITPGTPVLLGTYSKLPISLTFEGRFYDLSDFLYRLRNLVDVHNGTLSVGGRLFAVDSVTFDEGEAKFPQVEAALTLDAYVYGDPTVPGALPITPVTGSPTAAPAGATAAPAGVTG